MLGISWAIVIIFGLLLTVCANRGELDKSEETIIFLRGVTLILGVLLAVFQLLNHYLWS